MKTPRNTLAFALLGLLLASASAACAPRYNVLFVPCDDLNPSLGCYGNDAVHTPNIDRLAASGVRFARAYSQFASCLPSRASFLSGWYPDYSKVLDFSPKSRDGRMKDVVYLPQHFRNEGYFTVRLDKVFHINADDPASWDVTEEPLPGPQVTWEKREVEALGLQGRILKEGGYPHVNGEKGFYAVLDVEDEQLFDGMKTDRAIAIMEQATKIGKPFFLACGYRRPHQPWIAPKEYFDLYPPERIALPPPHPNDNQRLSEKEHREMLAHYYATISYLDAQVGRLIGALDRLGLREQTIVVLFGDNGYCLGERNMHFGKGNLWERSVWVPLIIAAPGSPRNGSACTRSVGLIDLYPTLVELCGLPPPTSGLQGRSLAPFLSRDDPAWEDRTISIYPLKKGHPAWSVRTDRHRYTEGSDGVPLELVDYGSDPYEWRNLVAEPDHAGTLATLQALVAKHRRQFWK